jgi:hypothetical protein
VVCAVPIPAEEEATMTRSSSGSWHVDRGATGGQEVSPCPRPSQLHSPSEILVPRYRSMRLRGVCCRKNSCALSPSPVLCVFVSLSSEFLYLG